MIEVVPFFTGFVSSNGFVPECAPFSTVCFRDFLPEGVNLAELRSPVGLTAISLAKQHDWNKVEIEKGFVCVGRISDCGRCT